MFVELYIEVLSCVEVQWQIDTTLLGWPHACMGGTKLID